MKCVTKLNEVLAHCVVSLSKPEQCTSGTWEIVLVWGGCVGDLVQVVGGSARRAYMPSFFSLCRHGESTGGRMVIHLAVPRLREDRARRCRF